MSEPPRRYRIWFQGATDRVAHQAYISRLEPHLRRLVDPQFDFTFNTTTPPATTTHPITEFRMARARSSATRSRRSARATT